MRKDPLHRSVSAMPDDDPFVGKLYDPGSGIEPFRMQSLSKARGQLEPGRTNYFTVVWVEAGEGRFWADAAQHSFQADQLLFFLPYQYFRFELAQPLQATMVHFHANFLCVETFHAETGCSGLLFKDLYGPPLVTVDRSAKADIAELLQRMNREIDEQRVGYRDALLAYLKLLLIKATRLKASRTDDHNLVVTDFRHPLIETLRELIEGNYRILHAPSDYADLLHVTTKTLGRCVRERLGKTPTELVRERILMHAKWELLHTLKPIKEIADEVGFQDELYFSRLFKKATGVSRTYFREFETKIRGGSNLSMSWSH